ncbi:MAG: glycosyltransferase family 4 protein [Prevotellaceae bacterium]|nr:glycosyltransferase family 4 protein [Candidatus Minthosoma equi]
MKLCIIYNFSQKYREGIYKLLDTQYDCHWVFGKNNTDIKELDDSVLKDVTYIDNVWIKPFYYQKGVVSLMKKYDTFLMLGELFCISTWMMLILAKTIYPKKRIYIWSHGWYGKENKIKLWMKHAFFSMADAVLLYGNHAKDVARNFGYKKDNLYVIHNSLDYDKQINLRNSLTDSDIYALHFNNTNPVLLFIGRLTYVKRLDLLLKAVAELKGNGTKCNVVLVGNGEAKDNLSKMAQDLKITDNVWFYGACYDEKENAQLIYNADVCVAPGNVGLTAMHTMVYGTPVITHDDFAWQMPEYEAIKPNETGNFFERDNVGSLADCIASWICSHDEEREQVRKNCYSEIDTNWTPNFQLNIIKQVIK